jgi:hypothetical protein
MINGPEKNAETPQLHPARMKGGRKEKLHSDTIKRKFLSL